MYSLARVEDGRTQVLDTQQRSSTSFCTARAGTPSCPGKHRACCGPGTRRGHAAEHGTARRPAAPSVSKPIARTSITRWISARYSSSRCRSQNASVSAVRAENFSAMARGILSGEGMVVVGALGNGFPHAFAPSRETHSASDVACACRSRHSVPSSPKRRPCGSTGIRSCASTTARVLGHQADLMRLLV